MHMYTHILHNIDTNILKLAISLINGGWPGNVLAVLTP